MHSFLRIPFLYGKRHFSIQGGLSNTLYLKSQGERHKDVTGQVVPVLVKAHRIKESHLRGEENWTEQGWHCLAALWLPVSGARCGKVHGSPRREPHLPLLASRTPAFPPVCDSRKRWLARVTLCAIHKTVSSNTLSKICEIAEGNQLY